MAVCFTIANINNTDFYEHNKAVMEKYEGYQFYHAYGSPVANVVSFIFPILLMEIENGTSPNTDVAIYSGLLVAPERIDYYVFTERLTRFLQCLR